MKKKIISSLLVLVLSMSVFVGCGSKADNVSDNAGITTEAPTTTPESTEAPHEHTYAETVTTEPTCETDGEATYTCECGDSYTEPITAVGHVFETYTSNNDATYTADGTETAKCNNCDVTDTRTAEGSMLTYTYTDKDATMYAQKTVNVRSLPNTDGEKLGSLSTNDEVKVTSQCAETSWYRIEYSGGVAYVSNSYLGNDKVVVEQPKTEAPAQANNGGGSQNNTTSGNVDRTYEEAYAYFASKYPISGLIYNGDGSISCYEIISHGPSRDGAVDLYAQAKNELNAQGYTTVSGHADIIEKLKGADGYGQWSLYYWTLTGSN